MIPEIQQELSLQEFSRLLHSLLLNQLILGLPSSSRFHFYTKQGDKYSYSLHLNSSVSELNIYNLMKKYKIHIHIQAYFPAFNKGATSPLIHHSAEVLEEKSYQGMGEMDLFSNSSLEVSSIFFGSSSVPQQTPTQLISTRAVLQASRQHTGVGSYGAVLLTGQHQAQTGSCQNLKEPLGSPTLTAEGTLGEKVHGGDSQ